VTEPRAGTFAAFRSRDFRLLWGGQNDAWRGLWIGIGISAWMTLMSELVPERLLSRGARSARSSGSPRSPGGASAPPPE